MADSIDRGVGGYDNEFASPLPMEYECPICHLAFREPVQLEECGHRFCQSCLMELRKRFVKIISNYACMFKKITLRVEVIN